MSIHSSNSEHQPLLTAPQYLDFSEHPLVLASSGEYLNPIEKKGQKALAEQALGDVLPLPSGANVSKNQEVKTDEKLTTEAALKLLHKGNGFYPRENKEKNSLLEIAGRSTEVTFPVKRYLYEIEMHQEKSTTADPVAALRSKVHEFAYYARQSAMEIKMAKLFERTKVERNFRDAALVSEAISASYLEDDLPSRQTLTTLAGIRETDLFVEGEVKNPLGSKSGIDALVGKKRTARILELLGGMHISSLMNLNTRMMIEESNRFTYWRDRVSESKMYGDKIRYVSSELLTKLDELRPVQKS